MIGSPAVGKTSLVRRFVQGMFSDEYLTTIGVKIDRKIVRVGSQEITLILWDLAGDDAFQPLKTSYMRGMAGYLLVADGTRKSTIDHAVSLQERIESMHGNLPFILLINKHDLKDQWDLEDGLAHALRARGWMILETSALADEGVAEAFSILSEHMLSPSAA